MLEIAHFDEAWEVRVVGVVYPLSDFVITKLVLNHALNLKMH